MTDVRAGADEVALRHAGFRVWSRGVPGEWLRALCDAVAAASTRRFAFTAPDGADVIVKVQRRRPGHGLLRRFARSRALLEGRGYRLFARAGIATATLLAFGERRRLAQFERGFVATRRIDAPDVAARMAAGANVDLARRVIEVLARIHRAGLVHGDPLARNFIDARPLPIPIDLAGVRRASAASRRADLVRFLGSLGLGSAAGAIAAHAFDHYATLATPGAAREDVLRDAQRYAQHKDRVERARAERRARNRRVP